MPARRTPRQLSLPRLVVDAAPPSPPAAPRPPLAPDAAARNARSEATLAQLVRNLTAGRHAVDAEAA